jgi:hypothetical protein
MVESGPGGIRDCETAGRDAKSSGVTNGDTSDFIVSNEEWLIGKESNAPWIGQAWRQIVGDARKVRGQIGLPVANRLRIELCPGQRNCNKQETRYAENNS